MFCDRIEWNNLDYAYDIETYPNLWTCNVTHINTNTVRRFEVSDRRNNFPEFYNFIIELRQQKARMVGFNNLGFDYPVIHEMLSIAGCGHSVTALDAYNKAQQIFNTSFDQKFAHLIWDDQQFVQQIDLYKIHHFDNVSRSTGLKVLEINMLSEDVGDLPFEPGTFIHINQIDTVVKYNDHDVNETIKFYKHSVEMIEFREVLSERYGRNFLNHNDTKIGKDYLIMKLEETQPGTCYTRNANNQRVPRQTWRHSMRLSDVVFPYIKFNHPEFQRVHQWLLQQTIVDTKGVFDNLSATVNGFKFDFGTGGIHGSVSSRTVTSDDEGEIIDLDVAAYYPSLAIVNQLYPEHLGDTFVKVYPDIKNERKKHKKGTAENKAMKLAGNGVYGDSNNKFSCFLDPMYTMKTTINGQLLLCMLAEYLMQIPGLKMIQANTDGVTVKCPRDQLHALQSVTDWWQKFTCLELERVEYSRMFIRDVNNYIAEKKDGKLKRKGAYCHIRPWEKDNDLEWHQDHSSLVIQKAAEAALVRGADIEQFIRGHQNHYDFLLRARASGQSKLVTEWLDGVDKPEQKTTRYYVSKIGSSLVKLMPPLQGKTDWRRIGINTSHSISVANNARQIDMSNIDYSYYIEEARKLVEPLR